MMRRHLRFLLASAVILPMLHSPAGLAQHNFGAGVVIGDPTGLTAKYYRDKKNAVDLALSFGGGRNVYLHSSWLWLREKLFNIDEYPVNWYFGFGGRFFVADHGHRHGPFGHHDHDDEDTHFAARAPFGLRMNFTDPRAEIFSEISFAMDVVPAMDFDLDFGIGARYYF